MSGQPPIIDPRVLDALLAQPIGADTARLLELVGGSQDVLCRELTRLRSADCLIYENDNGRIVLRRAGLPTWRDYVEWRRGCTPSLAPASTTVEVYRQTTSTQDAVRRVVDRLGRASDGAAVVADEQTAGRGRLGRRWVCPAGLGVTVSRAFVGDAGDASSDRLTLHVAVAVAEAVERSADLPSGTVRIKWPNDLLVDGRKLAGILVESARLEDGAAASIVGVGINTHVSAEDVPQELRDVEPAVTSMAMQGWLIDRLRVLAEVVCAMDALCGAKEDDLLGRWRVRSTLLGQAVRLRSDGREVAGEVVDIDPVRGLIVRGERGELVMLPAATTTVLQSTHG